MLLHKSRQVYKKVDVAGGKQGVLKESEREATDLYIWGAVSYGMRDGKVDG